MQEAESARGGAGSGGEPCYLVDIIEVKQEYLFDYYIKMWDLVEDELESRGWELIFGGRLLTGRPTQVLNVWKIPDADLLRETVDELRGNRDYQELQRCIASEQRHLVELAKYDKRLPLEPGIVPEALVICADDGELYLVSQETYTAERLPSKLDAAPKSLLAQGSVIASIEPDVGAGSACYLLNLPLIRKPNEWSG